MKTKWCIILSPDYSSCNIDVVWLLLLKYLSVLDLGDEKEQIGTLFDIMTEG